MTAAFPEIVLLRHGETQWNRVARYQGQQDSPLTLTGVGQIRAIAQSLRPRLRDLSLCRVWSSPLPRTRQSVSILCEELGLPYEAVRFDERLMERAYGRWEGLTSAEVGVRYREDKEMEAADRWSFAIPGGGESFAAVAERLRDWLHGLTADRTAIVMAHGGCGRVLRGICTGAEPQAVFAYDDPQSTAILLADGGATPLPAEPGLLARYGCRDAGRRVRI
ncbi:histidine phosphatase family protein [Oleispirillum naphthae]|uniref:histidine phosphatase family protein n=1 Tax=Oleispirillum naphthae TaxID=2838853 RepID=UPI0030825BDE